MLQPNPKYRVKLVDADGDPITELLFHDNRAGTLLEHWEEEGIPLEPTTRPGELAFWGGRGRPVLWLRPLSRTIYFWEDPASLTLAHVLSQVAQLEELDDCELVQRVQTEDCWQEWCGEPLGMTLGQYVAALRQYEAELPAREHFRDEPRPRRYDYLVYRHPFEIEWYHATLAANVESILKHGLRPSQPGEGGGWSPHWNLGLQRVVYLTADYNHACDIAETVALRGQADAVVIAVAPGALEDLSRLRIDEDAVIDKLDGGLNFEGMTDQDFPEWETSWHQYAGQSIAYAGTILPEYLRVVGVGTYTESQYEHHMSGEIQVEADVEWTDLEE